MGTHEAIIRLNNKTFKVKAGIRLNKALRILRLTPGAHLAVRNGVLITEDENLAADDVIELIAVISGG